MAAYSRHIHLHQVESPLTSGFQLLHYGDAFLSSRVSIFSRSRGSSIGLVSKSSHPAWRAWSLSVDIAWAVKAITGMESVPGSSLSLFVASQPLRTGRLISIRIKSGVSERAMATP